jgi:glycosyltransferase involved in cell wall biosynthesis
MRYVLITAARNEDGYIEKTICSVLSQTRLPLRWVIVSDGSTDRTDEIVKQYARQHNWIDLLRMPEHRERQFAAKAHCFNAGFARVRDLDFDIIGNLDADITFDPDYIEFLLGRFASDPKLGVAGTPYVEDLDRPASHTYAHQFAQLEHVSGACQLFRRECFDDVGGYEPIKGGAIDWIAVTTARMKGWRTRTFLEKACFHHRKLGTGTDSLLMVRFRYGKKAYSVGGHPLWELLRAVFQMKERPFFFGGTFFLAGYLWAYLTKMDRPISSRLIDFHRAEQMTRLRHALSRFRNSPRTT